ncbi:uncharacterized protein LOC106380154 isoform X4 [Brassica napus]|uniref:uncharacterized protein LOC106380154 isoform X4 n=1 Tax=Brassica napus TaxID=3708 RepID=UPI002079C969|nr:uncharacterized protein LOC106380154 isoform X4 [Brassica napus]
MAILLSTAHLLRDGSPVDESPPKSSLLDGSPPEASLGGSHHRSLGASPSLSILSADLSTVLSVIRKLKGEVRFDHQDCISKEIKEKQPFPPQLKFSDYTWVLITAIHNLHRMRRLVGLSQTVTTTKSNLSFSKTKLS